MVLSKYGENDMNNKDIEKLYEDLNVGIYKDREGRKMIMSRMAAIYLDKTDSVNFLLWLTEKTQMGVMHPQEVKGIQHIINKTPTQRLLLGLTEKEKPTQRVRLVRGNKPLLRKGLCSQSQIDAKEYLFIVEDLNDHIDYPNKPIKEEEELIIGALDIDDDIRDLMKNLEHKEMEIVILYFGLYKDKPMSLEKVAKRLGKSREWTRKRLNNALETMKVIS